MTDEAADMTDSDALGPGEFAPDPALEAFQGSANRVGVGFNFVLTAQGQTILGTMIGMRDWFDALSEQVSGAGFDVPDGEDLAPARQWLEGMSRLIREFPGPEEPEQTMEQRLAEPVPRFIHLQNAKIITGGVPMDIGLWRGRLSQIGGWSIANGPS